MKRALGMLVRLVMAGALLLVIASGFVIFDGRRERLAPADVIVIPANTVLPGGTPSPRLAARLDRGLQVYRAELATHIIVSGGIGRERQDEAAAMRRYLLARGVPDSAIVVDAHGVNTWETARFVSRWLRDRGGSRAIVVSQAFHVSRCKLALRRFGVISVGSAAARYWEWRDLYSTPRETIGLVSYALRRAP